MLCEKCKKNPSTIHMKQMVNGETHETYLCESCALNMESMISFDNFFKGFLDSFLIGQLGNDKGISKNDTLKCGTCGLTYEKFKMTSRLGCSDCYTTFKNQLSGILKNIQGSNVHQGKLPKRAGSDILLARKVEELRSRLSRAIQREEYEEAAKLRDEIKSLELGC